MIRPPRILFFADAGQAVGGGHVMRCLTLAEALMRAGAVCAFAATPQAAAVLEVFADQRIERLAMPAGGASACVAAAAQAARAWGADAAVLDHYGAAAADEAWLRASVLALLVIDDLQRRHACDLVLDSNLGRTAADYPDVEALAGPSFALIRPGFALLREATLAGREFGGSVARILVSLGLTDVGGVTARVVKALLPVIGPRILDAVVGGAAASLPELESEAAIHRRLTVHVDTTDMAGLIAGADLAVGAGGSSVWERACLGLPTVTVVLAENQRANTLALVAAGATVMADATAADFEAELVQTVTALIADDERRRALTQASAGLCDGGGAERAARRLLALIDSHLSAHPREGGDP